MGKEFSIVLLKVPIFKRINLLVSKVALANTAEQVEVSLGQSDVLVVEVVMDLGPPLLVGLPLDKLGELILLCRLDDFLTFDRVSLVIVQGVPLSWHIACAEQYFLIGGVI